MSRSKEREIVVTILYQIIMYNRNNVKYNLDQVINENVKEESEYINNSINNILEKETDIKKIINENLNNWTIDRLSSLDAAILTNGVYELLYTDTPDIVAINEAIELSKKFSDEKVSKMINGVLDKIRISNE